MKKRATYGRSRLAAAVVAAGLALMGGGSAYAQSIAAADATIEPFFIGGAGLQQEGDFGAFFGTLGDPIMTDSVSGVDDETTWIGFWRAAEGDLTSGIREFLVPWTPGRSGIQSTSPNPFTGSTRIEVNLARAGHLRVMLHDQVGREVFLLVDARREAGTVVLDWRPEGLPAGSYLLGMELDGIRLPSRLVQYYR
jgi:hypothetical protein